MVSQLSPLLWMSKRNRFLRIRMTLAFMAAALYAFTGQPAAFNAMFAFLAAWLVTWMLVLPDEQEHVQGTGSTWRRNAVIRLINMILMTLGFLLLALLSGPPSTPLGPYLVWHLVECGFIFMALTGAWTLIEQLLHLTGLKKEKAPPASAPPANSH